jgi:hypothetical protein
VRLKHPAPICPYCDNKADLVSGRVIYPERPEFNNTYFWLCAPCDAYVGTHRDARQGYKPLGTLATKELRLLRMECHKLFDPLWQSNIQSNGLPAIMLRSRAYGWLAAKLDVPISKCHIGMFDVAACRATIATLILDTPI